MDQNSAVTLSVVVLAQSSLGSIPMMSCWVWFLPGIPSLSWPRLGLWYSGHCSRESFEVFHSLAHQESSTRATLPYYHTKLALKKEKVFNPKIVWLQILEKEKKNWVAKNDDGKISWTMKERPKRDPPFGGSQGWIMFLVIFLLISVSEAQVRINFFYIIIIREI